MDGFENWSEKISNQEESTAISNVFKMSFMVLVFVFIFSVVELNRTYMKIDQQSEEIYRLRLEVERLAAE